MVINQCLLFYPPSQYQAQHQLQSIIRTGIYAEQWIRLGSVIRKEPAILAGVLSSLKLDDL